MEYIIDGWRPLTINKINELAEASNTLHHAAQFIALTGKYLQPDQADDSHTAATWDAHYDRLTGPLIRFTNDYIRVSINYLNFSLLILDEKNNILQEMNLSGKTNAGIYGWLKGTLLNFSRDAEVLDEAMHYEMPDHPVLEGESYIKPDNKLLSELAAYRTNGHLLLKHFKADFKTAHDIIVWPHHFDEGCYIPLLFDHDKVIGSINIGMAISDRYYKTPYLYITALKHDGISYDKLPALQPPGRWHEHEWTGQVLVGEDLLKIPAGKQAETSFAFIVQAIKNARGLIGWPYNL